MSIKKFKPVTPASRYKTVLDFDDITEKKPFKPLTKGKKNTAGRGAKGRISVRRRGGGHKRRYRIIDFKRNKHGVPGNVASIEYDPNRSANIALINYLDGEKRYIIAPVSLKVGDVINSGENAEIKPGNSLPLKKAIWPHLLGRSYIIFSSIPLLFAMQPISLVFMIPFPIRTEELL